MRTPSFRSCRRHENTIRSFKLDERVGRIGDEVNPISLPLKVTFDDLAALVFGLQLNSSMMERALYGVNST